MITGPDQTIYPVASGAADGFLQRFTGLAQARVRRDTGIGSPLLSGLRGGELTAQLGELLSGVTLA